jgi:hypothetical protein
MASTPSSSATSTIWCSDSSVSCATRGRLLQPSQAGRRALERARDAARLVVQLAGTVHRHADVTQESGVRQVRQGLGALVGDDRAVRREIPADVALVLEDLHDAEDVLAHEDLAASHRDLKAVLVGERAAERVERQLLPPLALDVQQVTDVAELAVQIAPHGRLVDDAVRQPSGASVLALKELVDLLLVLAPAIERPQARGQRHPARAARHGLTKTGCNGDGQPRHCTASPCT